uniref:Uncharacterized protein n=1 Tax=Mandrillus leucophaeus TaxID=9568 RepID=A0A2K6ALE1_MANLE
MDPVQCGLPWCPRIGASLSLNVQSISTANMCFLMSDQTVFLNISSFPFTKCFSDREAKRMNNQQDRAILVTRAFQGTCPELQSWVAFYPLSFYCLRMATAVSLKALS